MLSPPLPDWRHCRAFAADLGTGEQFALLGSGGNEMNLLLALVIALMVLALPTWPYAATWGYGYYPTGGLGIILLVLIVVMLTRRRV
jgi:hypothetical protein